MIPTNSKREASASPLESNGFAPHIPSSATNEFAPNPLRSVSNEPFTQELGNLKLEYTFTDPLPGSRGLSNLGNTCFMNSALQCLSHTMPLTLYFLQGKWEKDLNPDNHLGSDNGQLAKAYCALIEKLWNPNETCQSYSPREFKYEMGIFNSLFKGYSQQDSQELLQSLLDALHEDLNRILKKPYIEIPDMDHLSQEEMAAQSWEYYSKRNDSIIVDLFQGQYKSRVECLVCGKWSLKFDPYMFLSLPIPGASMSLFNITVLPPGQLVSNLNNRNISLILTN
jgi:ubiquitin carboxyl-terminal hydrolase 4/11/15